MATLELARSTVVPRPRRRTRRVPGTATTPRGRSGRPRRREAEHRFAQALGWFSVGLGVAELAAPGALARLTGGDEQRANLWRTLGARELSSGLGLLTQRRKAAWLWSRVAGDAIDLALLAACLRGSEHRGRAMAATAAVLGVTALDLVASRRFSEAERAGGGGFQVHDSVTILKPASELFRFWRRLDNLPRFMQHLVSVEEFGDGRSHWVARAPGGTTVSWIAEIVDERQDERIAWRSLPASEVHHSGSVRFEPAPAGRGTVVRVDFGFSPPAGAAGLAVAKLFGESPDQQVHDDLRRFKQVMETGDIVTTEGQPAARRSSTSWRFDRTARR